MGVAGNSFVSLVGSQILYLVTSLTKKNYKTNVAELHNLIDLYGDDTNVLLLQALVDTIDVRSDKGNGAQRDSRVQLLTQEISALSGKENFVSVICKAFGSKLDFADINLATISRALKLSLTHELLLGTALSFSSDTSIREEGSKFLNARLPQLCEAGADILPEQLAHQLMYCVRTMDAFKERRQEVLDTLSARFGSQADPLLIDDLSVYFPTDATARSLTARVSSACSLGKVMLDLGYRCTSTPAECAALLHSLPKLTESAVAVALGVMVRTREDLASDGAIVNSPFDQRDTPPAVEGEGPSTWNVEIFVATVQKLYPNLKWPLVFQLLDHPGFFIPDAEAFLMLMKAFRSASEGPFPISVVFGTWNNTVGQVSFLQHAILAPADVFSFAASPRRQDPFDLSGKTRGSQNFAWNSLDLIETLLELSESQHYTTIRNMFENPIKQCPELLLLGLAQTKVQNLMQKELVNSLVPTFLNNHPGSSAILHQLWAMRPDMVAGGMAEFYARDAGNLSRALEVAQDLKALMPILDARPLSFVIDFAALAACWEFLNLEKWFID